MAAALFCAAGLLLSACGDTTVVAGSEAGSGAGASTTAPPVLDAVLEPMDADIADFGSGWELIDRWFTEGPDVEWDTGCRPFDELDVFARSGPATSVWASESADMVYRVQSLDFLTAAYADAAATVAAHCPTIELDGEPVALTSIDAGSVFGHEGEDITVSAIGFDSFPVASRDTDLTSPVFERGRTTWQVTLTRHNTVSQVTYAPDPGATAGDIDFAAPPEELVQIVGLAWEGLSAAPVVATGPIEQPAPPQTAGDQVVHDVVLRLGFDCFENSAISVGGLVFGLLDPLPDEWQGLTEVSGTATIEGELATFVADDGTTLRLSSGDRPSVCTYWEFEENPPDTDTGRLDCGHPAAELVESRHPDTGQGPEALAAAEVPGSVAVEEGDPLMWWAVDADGTVLAGIFLGDAEGADYQIFRCAD